MLATRQVVNFVKIHEIREPVETSNTFAYRQDRGWLWLQRAAFFLLRWVGAYHINTVTTYRRTPQQNDDLLKSLLGQEGHWLAHVHHSRENARIYMGPDDYEVLLAFSEFRNMQATTLDARIETKDRHYGRWHNIPITVVPWMKGAIIVPA